jgi:hypothetical protein
MSSFSSSSSFVSVSHPLTRFPHWSHSVCSDPVAGFIYSFGGYSLSTRSNALLRYSPGLACWQALAPSPGSAVPPAREHSNLLFVSTSLGPRLFLFFGRSNPGRGFSDAWLFDPDAVEWRELLNLRDSVSARWRCAALAMDDNRLVCFGGRDADGPIGEALTIDCRLPPEQWQWSVLEQNGEKPSERAAAAINRYKDSSIMLFGGLERSWEPIDPVFYTASLSSTALDWSASQLHQWPCSCAESLDLCHCRPTAIYSHSIHYIPSLEVLLVIGGCSNRSDYSGAFQSVSAADCRLQRWIKVKADESVRQSIHLKQGVIASGANTLTLIGGGCNVFHFNSYYNGTRHWTITMDELRETVRIEQMLT